MFINWAANRSRIYHLIRDSSQHQQTSYLRSGGDATTGTNSLHDTRGSYELQYSRPQRICFGPQPKYSIHALQVESSRGRFIRQKGVCSGHLGFSRESTVRGHVRSPLGAFSDAQDAATVPKKGSG